MNNNILTPVKLWRNFNVHHYSSKIRMYITSALVGVCKDASMLDLSSINTRLLDPNLHIWEIQVSINHSPDSFTLSREELENMFQKLHNRALYDYDDELESLREQYITAQLNNDCPPSFCVKLQHDYADFDFCNFYRLWEISVISITIEDSSLFIRISTDYSWNDFFHPKNFWDVLHMIS